MKLIDISFQLGKHELVPLVIGGMGVDISTSELALEGARLGGVGHISDAMVQHVSDRKFDTKFSKAKSDHNRASDGKDDKTSVKFILEDLRAAQLRHVESTMQRKKGSGLVFVNVMEKLTMGAPAETLKVRLHAALDGGIDGITLSAGLHLGSLGLMADNPRFREAKIGIIVSSVRALKIFLRSAGRQNRMPDYIIVEGPLAGGHLGFGEEWKTVNLKDIVVEVVQFMKDEGLSIPIIPAGGVFTGTDAVEMVQLGAAAVQVATRFTITRESGLPKNVKQEYFKAEEEEIIVSDVSPTGYLIRMLNSSPCLNSNMKPSCEPFGYILNGEGKCSYVNEYASTGCDEKGKKLGVKNKVCLCYHFSKYNCWTCGHNVYRLKDTTVRKDDGSYQLLTAEHVFNDYLYSQEHSICLPKPEIASDQPKAKGEITIRL